MGPIDSVDTLVLLDLLVTHVDSKYYYYQDKSDLVHEGFIAALRYLNRYDKLKSNNMTKYDYALMKGRYEILNYLRKNKIKTIDLSEIRDGALAKEDPSYFNLENDDFTKILEELIINTKPDLLTSWILLKKSSNIKETARKENLSYDILKNHFHKILKIAEELMSK